MSDRPETPATAQDTRGRRGAGLPSSVWISEGRNTPAVHGRWAAVETRSQSISRSLSPLATTMGFLTVPVVGLVSSWVILGEPLTVLDLAGATTTFLGIVVVSVSSGGTGSGTGQSH